MKNLLFFFCFLTFVDLSAQEENYEWATMDTTYVESMDFEIPELPPLGDLSPSFYAPLQTKIHTYIFDIPILNKGVQATQACELQLIHIWTDANGQKHRAKRVEIIPALIPGQMYTLRIKIKDASFRQLGHQTYSTFIQVDPLGRITEQDEGNNIVRYVPGQYQIPESVETNDEEMFYEHF